MSSEAVDHVGYAEEPLAIGEDLSSLFFEVFLLSLPFSDARYACLKLYLSYLFDVHCKLEVNIFSGTPLYFQEMESKFTFNQVIATVHEKKKFMGSRQERDYPERKKQLSQ